MAHGQSLAQLPPCLAVPLARVREAIVGGGAPCWDCEETAAAAATFARLDGEPALRLLQIGSSCCNSCIHHEATIPPTPFY
uniref:Uncharacterized protein n=1 Tax=Oryza nivara TaxID=4536 RepID=A0A0E0FXI7_ORYNI